MHLPALVSDEIWQWESPNDAAQKILMRLVSALFMGVLG